MSSHEKSPYASAVELIAGTSPGCASARAQIPRRGLDSCTPESTNSSVGRHSPSSAQSYALAARGAAAAFYRTSGAGLERYLLKTGVL